MISRNYQMTDLERLAADILDKLQIKYTPQYSTRTGFVIDFMLHLTNRDVPLETDGIMHKGKHIGKDWFRTQILKREGRDEPIRISYKELTNKTMEELIKEKLNARGL